MINKKIKINGQVNFLQIQDNKTSEEELTLEDNTSNREAYPLLFTLKYILDFYYGEIALNTIISFSAK